MQNIISRRTWFSIIAMIGVHCCFVHGARAADPDMQALRELLGKWVETRQLISEEKQDWKESETMLEERIDLMKDRISEVRESINKAQDGIATTEEKHSELTAENKSLEDALNALRTRLVPLESRTLQLLGRLPQPAREKVKALSQQIPENPDKTELSLSTRYQNLIGVLNEINKFNNEVLVTTEVRQLTDGKSMEVKVLYFGLGQAYYCNQEGNIGGVGRPGEQGWQWQRQDDIAPRVATAIAVYRNEQPASYQPLPVKITE